MNQSHNSFEIAVTDFFRSERMNGNSFSNEKPEESVHVFFGLRFGPGICVDARDNVITEGSDQVRQNHSVAEVVAQVTYFANATLLLP